MKKVLAILLIIVLGIALGVGVAMLRIKASLWNPKLDEGEPAAGASNAGGDKPGTKVTQFGPAAVAAVGCRRADDKERFRYRMYYVGFSFSPAVGGRRGCRALVSALGCPSSGEKPGVAETSALRIQRRRRPTNRSRLTKPPVAEFQQPPALPPSEPPPRLSPEPDDVPPPAKAANPAGKVADAARFAGG